jgi:protein-tyrosine-phosphatase
MKQRALFLCTHNSARGRTAGGFLRHLAGDRFEVASAGTEKTTVRSEAIAVMESIASISGWERSSRAITGP